MGKRLSRIGFETAYVYVRLGKDVWFGANFF